MPTDRDVSVSVVAPGESTSFVSWRGAPPSTGDVIFRYETQQMEDGVPLRMFRAYVVTCRRWDTAAHWDRGGWLAGGVPGPRLTGCTVYVRLATDKECEDLDVFTSGPDLPRREDDADAD